MTERVPWEELPAGLRGLVEDRTGGVTAATPVVQGLNCTVAQVLVTRESGPLFLKGVRDTDLDGVAALRWEERVNRAVAGIGPGLLHSVRADGWYCLLFSYVAGRNADLGPGSPDLGAVAVAGMNRPPRWPGSGRCPAGAVRTRGACGRWWVRSAGSGPRRSGSGAPGRATGGFRSLFGRSPGAVEAFVREGRHFGAGRENGTPPSIERLAP